jgi:protein-tyrosine-phosphatase
MGKLFNYQSLVAEMKKSDKIQVLFICTGNSARSQMAEGLLRERAGNMADVCSAGTKPAEDIHPLARKVMEENGIDPSMQYPKNVEIYLKREFDVIVTACDGARENCPFFPGNARRYHWGLEDPAAVKGDKETRLAAFRKTFAELSERVSALVKVIREMRNIPA